MSTVLIVDDKEMMRESVTATLTRAGMEAIAAESGERAIELASKCRPDAVVSDLRMPGMGGLELLSKLKAIDEDLPVVLMTAFGAVDTAIQAMKAGAFDYITKPFEGDELVIAVKRAIRHARVVRENTVLRAQGEGREIGHGLDRVIGESPAIRRVKEQVRAVANSGGNVLICGESGTGKEVIARAIHELSPRGENTMLCVNCAALSESLLESELFGHERGAFTGAERMRKGRFELADGGTLLLDEISEVSPKIQAKLLRVLQEQSFERVGSSTPVMVDVRVVATSNRDLPRAVGTGEFRQDLFFRLNVLPIHMPPLRDRVEDIAALSGHFIAGVCERDGRAARRFDADAIALLQRYDWPGNVRELQNICERAVVLSASGSGVGSGEGGDIGAGLIEPWLGQMGGAVIREPKPMVGGVNGANGAHGGVGESFAGRSFGTVNGNGFMEGHGGGETSGPIKTLAEIEREVIVQTLRRFNGHRQRTAKALGIGVRTLGLKLKKWKEEQLVEQTL